MGTTQKNVMQQKQQNMVLSFTQALRNVFIAKAETKAEKEPKVKGYYRSMFYTAPPEFYSHKSGTFARNQRLERKLGRKRRAA